MKNRYQHSISVPSIKGRRHKHMMSGKILELHLIYRHTKLGWVKLGHTKTIVLVYV